MPARKPVASNRDDDRDVKIQHLADEVTKINLRQQEVFTPSLKRIETTVQTIAQGDFMTRSEAEAKFSSKEDVKFLKNIIYTLGAAFAAFILAQAFGLFGGPK